MWYEYIEFGLVIAGIIWMARWSAHVERDLRDHEKHIVALLEIVDKDE